MYADDILIINEKISDIHDALLVVEDWAETHNMIINKGKSGVI